MTSFSLSFVLQGFDARSVKLKFGKRNEFYFRGMAVVHEDL